MCHSLNCTSKLIFSLMYVWFIKCEVHRVRHDGHRCVAIQFSADCIGGLAELVGVKGEPHEFR